MTETINVHAAKTRLSELLALEHRAGRLDMAGQLIDGWDAAMVRLQADELPITRQHALAAGSLDWEHRDPFDRLLVAQARVEGLTLVTADRAVLRAPGVRLQPW